MSENTNTQGSKDVSLLKQRVAHLEKSSQKDLELLEMLLQMSNIYAENAHVRDKNFILTLLNDSLAQLLQVDVNAFFIVNEDDANFELFYCNDTEQSDQVELLKQHLIDTGEFAWALSQNKTVVVESVKPEKTILLHVLSTKYRVRGMYLGVVPEQCIPSAKVLRVLTAFMQQAAYSIESIELYNLANSFNEQLKNTNAQLEQKVEQRTQSLKAATEKANNASKAKSDFVANMVHDLRSPLTAIQGFANMLLQDEDEPLTTVQQDSLQYIVHGSNHLSSLINQTLDLAKIEAGQVSLNIDTIDMIPIITEAMSLLAPLTEQRGITVTFTPSQSLFVKADALRLKQIVLNLLSNAIKYNKPSGAIHIQSKQDEDMVCLLVKDTGIGIPENMQPKLFTSFSRLGQEEKLVEGTGIGLVICKALIEAMQGKMGAESIEDIGSEFWFELPKA
jgi:signal transduction histidine kinase